MKKKRATVLFTLFIIPLLIAARGVQNPVRPQKGTHIFPMKEIWRVQGGGDILFGNVITVAVSDSEHVFARDLKNREYYAFDEKGNLLRAFGQQGEGPGQVRDPGGAGIYAVKNRVLVTDPDKIHHFDDEGRYLKSVRKTRPVSLFLSENEYISAPASNSRLPSDQARIRYVNLETGKETVIADFTLLVSGVFRTGRRSASVTMPTITPMMIFGSGNKKIYYSMNNEYTIHITDTSGADFGQFSLDRQGEEVSLKDRENVLKELVKGYGPEELAIRLAKTLPDRQTPFSSIECYEGKLYLAQSHFVPVNRQEFDIFSPEGHYLYRAIITIEEGSRIRTEPIFKNDHVYLVIEDEEGDIYIAKYRTTLPG
jgi:hypothetical protein